MDKTAAEIKQMTEQERAEWFASRMAQIEADAQAEIDAVVDPRIARY